MSLGAYWKGFRSWSRAQRIGFGLLALLPVLLLALTALDGLGVYRGGFRAPVPIEVVAP